MIHTTVGVYNNGERKTNGVPSENLAHHIHYNITNRFGRALFLDGYLIYRGYLNQDEALAIQEELLKNPLTQLTDTQPYI